MSASSTCSTAQSASFTTSFRMGQILRWGVDLPEPPAGASPEELERFLVTELVETLRREFAAKGFAKRTRATIDGDPSATEEGQDRGGLFLLGVAGQIFEIRSDFQVARPLTPYTAIGNGAAVALGALHALERFPDLSSHERVRRALEASEASCPGVRGPFCFVELIKAS